MGNELKKWCVTGPDGFSRVVEMPEREWSCEALAIVRALKDVKCITLALQAGYRAEPIKEPKVVTVSEELISDAVWLAEIGLDSLVRMTPHAAGTPRTGKAGRVLARLRAAIDGAK